MPGHGPHHFYFEGEPPLLFKIFAILFALSIVLMLGLTFGAKYFLPKSSATLPLCEELSTPTNQVHAPAFLCWYVNHDIAITWILIGLIALTMVIYRKRVRYYYSGRNRRSV
jgi:hypothetical protein